LSFSLGFNFPGVLSQMVVVYRLGQITDLLSEKWFGCVGSERR
jgi:hypothetical protein